MNVHSINRATPKVGRKATKSKTSDRRRSERRKADRRDVERRPRGRPLVDDKRRVILDAALRVFAERGYHGTVVPEIAVAAGVSVGTLYNHFENKDALVNEVFRDAKLRLRTALVGNVAPSDSYTFESGRAWFGEVWRRLGAFSRAEPEAFRFLEMQDHVPYLDDESRQVELTVLGPLLHAGKRLRDMWGGPPV